MNQDLQTVSAGAHMRESVPAPFAATLAICSDLDETADAETYLEMMRFLNTTETTSMGQGVGLEIGNTMYFDMPPGHLSYWNASESEREKFRALMLSGHIDCIHSFGDLASSRRQAGRALDELQRYGCKLQVWIDHAQAPTNLGSDIMQGHGDDPNHGAYHADLTCAYGVKYVWRGRVTSVVGQERRSSLRGIANWHHPLDSARTLVKEAVKQIAGRIGSRKYRLHARNRILGRARLRDGQTVSEFLRSSPHWKGISGVDTGDGIAEVLTSRFLDQLIRRRGTCILYTHLGKIRRGNPRIFPPATIAAFRRLAEYNQAGKIRVTTTRRLLGCVAGEDMSDPGKRLTYPL